MEFDMSKENIQPLRGGRNRAILEVALQAQADTELQKELIQQREEHENIIKTYNGDDPLDNWYSYISWIEQSYPKHGHEGNLLNVLEDCLSKFENDQRYIHDMRMCKLWIKYVDLQQNPDELFQLLHAKGVCVSCADLYRAWAFYHEIAGDYKRANAVYQLGLQALAQPYEELEQAQKNMFMAAGRQIADEIDDKMQQQIENKRHALTSLRSYKHRTVVASTRVGHQVLRSAPGSLPSTSKLTNRSNKVVPIYSDENMEGAVGGYSGGIKSVLEVARRKEVIKENTLKPGPWTILKPKKKLASQHLTPAFKVHEDDLSTQSSTDAIQLYPNFYTTNLDDYSSWKIPRCIPEPDDPKKICMYPKNLIYTENNEYSLEEIKAQRRLNQKLKALSLSEEKMSVENFTIFEDEGNNCDNVNKISTGKNLEASKSFEIFTDDDDFTVKNNSKQEKSIPQINNFAIYEDGGNTCSQMSSKAQICGGAQFDKDNNFGSKVKGKNKLECVETNTEKNHRENATGLRHALFPGVLQGQGCSSRCKEDLNSLIPSDGFVLGRDKTDNVNSKIKEHVRSLIAKQPIQECSSDLIKLNRSLTK